MNFAASQLKWLPNLSIYAITIYLSDVFAHLLKINLFGNFRFETGYLEMRCSRIVGFFKRLKYCRLKTLRVCLTQTRSLYAASQLRLRNGAMQQLPKLTLCSVVAF